MKPKPYLGFSWQEIKSWEMALGGSLRDGVREMTTAGLAPGRKGGKNCSHEFWSVWISQGWLSFAVMFSCIQNLTSLESPRRRLLALGMLYIAPPASLKGKASLLRLGITDNWLLGHTCKSLLCAPTLPFGPPEPLWKGPSLLSCKIK